MDKALLLSVLKEQAEDFRVKDRGVPREILKKLSLAVTSSQIIVITGLRRVGKSTLLAQIADRYLQGNFYFVNFEDERLLNFGVGDFDGLHEALISLFGEKKTFLFDEIQNVPQWERFVRRLSDQGYKFIITGSNASLLSQELATRLTGRSLRVELFPFSFQEYLRFNHLPSAKITVLTTREKGQLIKLTNEFINSGGIPDALKYPELEIHKTLYNDVLHRDIATRYQLENVKSLKELAFYLISNVSSLISFNKLKGLLKLGSVNTVKSYIDYLESSWLFFVVNKYAFSVKEQQIAAKKIYAIDTGLVKSVGFSFSANFGKLMENLVFLKLKQTLPDIYYYRTEKNYEVDFFIPKIGALIQVADNFGSRPVKDREIRALIEACSEQKNIKKRLIITRSEKQIIKVPSGQIKAVPLYEWLLESRQGDLL